MKNALQLAVWVLVSVFAVQARAYATEISQNSNVPWLVKADDFMMASYTLPAAEVQPFLPDQLQLDTNEQGQVAAALEIYTTKQVVGIEPYSLAFLVIDVKGMPSRTGIPGHYAIWGGVLEAEALMLLNDTMGFPYQALASMKLETSTGQFSAQLVTASGEEVALTLTPQRDQPFSAEGVVDMLVAKPALAKSEVSFISRGALASVAELKVSARPGSALALLEGRQPQWAVIADEQTFTYSRLLPL